MFKFCKKTEEESSPEMDRFEKMLDDIMDRVSLGSVHTPMPDSNHEDLVKKLIEKSVKPTKNGFKFDPEGSLNKKELITYKAHMLKKMLK